MADCREKLENKTQLQKPSIDNVCKNASIVRLYTGIPSLACFFMELNFLQPIAEKLKYWEGKENSGKEAYQVANVFFTWLRLFIITINNLFFMFVLP